MSATLAVTYARSPNLTTLFGYAVRVSVTNATGMPAEIFVFQRGAAPAPGAGEQPQDVFKCVADPLDLEEIPVDAPDLLNEIPYYRKSEVTLGFRNADDRQSTIDDIASDIDGLVRAINAMTDLSETTTVTYPVEA